MELVCSGVCDVSMLGSGCLHPPSECSKTLFKTLLQLKTEAWHYQFILSSKVVSLKWLNHLSFGSMTLPRRLMGQIIENAGHKRSLEAEHRCQTEVSLLRILNVLSLMCDVRPDTVSAFVWLFASAAESCGHLLGEYLVVPDWKQLTHTDGLNETFKADPGSPYWPSVVLPANVFKSFQARCSVE